MKKQRQVTIHYQHEKILADHYVRLANGIEGYGGSEGMALMRAILGTCAQNKPFIHEICKEPGNIICKETCRRDIHDTLGDM